MLPILRFDVHFLRSPFFEKASGQSIENCRSFRIIYKLLYLHYAGRAPFFVLSIILLFVSSVQTHFCFFVENILCIFQK